MLPTEKSHFENIWYREQDEERHMEESTRECEREVGGERKGEVEIARGGEES